MYGEAQDEVDNFLKKEKKKRERRKTSAVIYLMERFRLKRSRKATVTIAGWAIWKEVDLTIGRFIHI